MARSDLGILNSFLTSKVNFNDAELRNYRKAVAGALRQTRKSGDIHSGEDEMHVAIIAAIMYLCIKGKIKVDTSHYKPGSTFMCKELKAIFQTFLDAENGHLDSDSVATFGASLLSMIDEGIDAEGYVRNDYWTQDLLSLGELVMPRVSDVDNGFNSAILQDIRDKKIPLIKVSHERVVEDVLEAWRVIYENTFGLYPYQGCFTFSSEKVLDDEGLERTMAVWFQPTGLESGRFRHCFSRSNEYDYLYEKLGAKLKALKLPNFSQCSSSFSVKYDDMLDGVVYFPSLCFALLSGSLVNAEEFDPAEESLRDYEKAGATKWEEYAASLRVSLNEMFARFSYKALERLTGEDFSSDMFIRLDDGGRLNWYKKNLTGTSKTRDGKEFSSELTSLYRNFMTSLCSACILARDDDGDLYRLLICTTDSETIKVERIFNDSNFIGANNIDWNERQMKCVPPQRIANSVGMYLDDITFCPDLALMDAKPLFGFEAAKKFQKQGIAVSNKKILLGEDEHGKPLFSQPKDSKIDTQHVIFHRVSAGSRSGKGVMTMNILASSVASGSAVFYIDRKPDMAGEIAYITNGNTFVVNGGSLSGTDVHRQFSGGGRMLSLYRERLGDRQRYYDFPYTTSVFGQDFASNYEGAFGDFVYYRAVSLVMNIMMARLMLMKSNVNSGTAFTELKLDTPMMVILDEMTNFHNEFENVYFKTDYRSLGGDAGITQSPLFNIYMPSYGEKPEDSSGTDAIESRQRQQLELCRQALQDLQDKAAGESDALKKSSILDKIGAKEKKIAELEKKIGDAEAAKNDAVIWLYWNTMFDSFQSILKELASLGNAGKTAGMFEKHDVWMIGQYLTGVAADQASGLFSKNATNNRLAVSSEIKTVADKDSNGAADVTTSWILSMFDSINYIGYSKCDWFIGRQNPGCTNFYGPWDVNGTKPLDQGIAKTFDWCNNRGNWAYCASGDANKLRISPVSDEMCVRFKPYLVLNTDNEPSGNTYEEAYLSGDKRPEDIYIRGVAERVGFDRFKKIRTRLLRPGVDSSVYGDGQLECGVGLRGLIEEYKGTSERGWVFSEDCMALSKDIADAVCRRFGYQDYSDYLFDFSPKAVINYKAILKMYEVADGKATMDDVLKAQFPRYFNTGNVSILTGEAASDDVSEQVGFAAGTGSLSDYESQPAEEQLSMRLSEDLRRKCAEVIVNTVIGASQITLDAERRRALYRAAYAQLVERGY